jgi:hypothetical protein
VPVAHAARNPWPGFAILFATLGVIAVAMLTTASTAGGAAPFGTGKTISYALSRSGSAGVVAGSCGTRLQCFKTAIIEANTNTTPTVERVALGLINVAEPDQDVNLGVSGKQLLIAPDVDPNLNGTADFVDALNRVSLGGGTCFTCALQAAERTFETARADSPKVIVLVSERVNVFRSTGFTSGGLPTGYPPMELSEMAGHFDANTVVRAFAVGPSVTCSADPNGLGSLNDAAAVTPGGRCIEVASFDNLGAYLIEALSGDPLPPPPPPPSGSYADAVRADTPRAYWRLGESSGTVAHEDQERANGLYSGGVVLGVESSNHDPDTAARFDGGNDKVGIADPADGSLDFGVQDFTVEAWIKPLASDERGIVVKRSSNAAEPYWALTVTDDSNHNGQIRANFFDGASVRTAYSLNSVVDGAWHHVVVWFDRDSGITIDVDGIRKFTPLAIAADVSNTGEIQIGKAPSNPYFRGDLDEVALYAGLLPVPRIQAHLAAA